MKLYTIATIGTSLLFLFLFIQLFFTPDAFIEDLGLQTSVPIPILGRRTAMFMLGFSVLLFGARKISHCEARQWICLSTGITMFGLAILSSYEMIRQTVKQFNLDSYYSGDNECMSILFNIYQWFAKQ
jgi:hypothetical protein